jgi:lysophospholipase L1-like esterase
VGSADSEYTRLLAVDPALSGHAYNDAKTGAKMADLDGQLRTAAGQGVGYATVLMGANDLCTSSVATMTPTATFESQFRQALTDLVQADPGVRVAVSSIPNIYQLWNTLHTNSAAVSTWRTFGICQSLLSSSNTEQQRQQVVAQEVADNTTLANVCAEFPQCHWDDGATYGVTFRTSDVSTVDYFHPSAAGQAKLSDTEWRAGYWG